MAFLGNILWFVFGGWLVGTIYLIGSLIFFPLLPLLIQFVGYSYWPFGRKPVSRSRIAAYRRNNPDQYELDDAKESAKTLGRIIINLLSIVWACTIGLALAVISLIAGVLSLFACVFIVTIPIMLPNALGWFKLVPISFTPMRYRVLRTALADEVLNEVQKTKL